MINIGPGTDIAPGTVFFSEFYRLGSLSFGGTSSLAISNGPILGSGAFTVEYWIKHGASVTLPTVLLASETGVYTGSGTRNTIFMEIGSCSIWQAGGRGTTQMANPTAWTNGAWQYVVLVRDASNNYTAFFNGSRSTTGATTDSRNYDQPFTSLGYWNYPPTNKYMKGNLTNIKVTVGQALYSPLSATIPVPAPTREQLVRPVFTAQTKLLMTTPEFAPTADFTNNSTLAAQNGLVTFDTQSPFP
jgi:hypothetical protein